MSGPESAGAAATPPGLERLDAKSRAEIAEAQATMRALIALIPRDFSYADEIDVVFQAEHSTGPGAKPPGAKL
jgi:hypothetical protein